MTTEALEVGLFALDETKRTLTGLLLPWNRKSVGVSASHTKPIEFPKDAVTLPADPIVIGLNDEHDRFDVIGRATAVESVDDGILATFALAASPEVDQWIEDHKDGPIHLSAEVANMTRAPGDIGGGRLAGAAVTTAPAFEGTEAALATFALLGDETVLEGTIAIDGADPAPFVATITAADAEVETEGTAMADATAPTGSFGRRQATTTSPVLTKAGFFAALHQARKTGDSAALRPYLTPSQGATGEGGAGMFALSNIGYDDAGTGLAADAQLPSTWLGELASGTRFARTVVPLLTPGVLTSLVANGWVWTTRPGVARWAGNKTPVPSNQPAVSPKDFTAQRFAGGHDLAREYYDFNVTEVIDSYLEAMVDSYMVESDDFALEQLEAGATAFTPTATSVSGQLAQMARAVIAARVAPTFAFVAEDVFDAFTDVPASDQSAYFSPTINLADGDLKGIPLIPDARLAAGQAIVGAKGAATAWELPGSPIRVSAPDLVLGGIDNALFGYIAVGVTYPAGVQKATITIV